MNVETLHDSNGRTWQEVRSKTYNLKDVADYLQSCIEEPQKDIAVCFTIRDDGELIITTSNAEQEGETEGSGFTELQ